MRRAKVYYKSHLAGMISETSEGEFVFQYDKMYVREHSGKFITFTMPVREEPYIAQRLFPVFEGLIPEGWLLDIASNSWKINKNDHMGLLMACCQDCIGALSVLPIQEEDEQ
jgi:serine/threonine-protein kinase HipA